MFKKMSLAAKISCAFSVVILTLISTILVTLYQVDKSETINKRLIDLRSPTLLASINMMNGVNHSLAALRGWIILGKDKFKDERLHAWEREIAPTEYALKKLAEQWTNPENIKRLEIVQAELLKFKGYQQAIEDIAQTAFNEPAKQILYADAAPLARIITSRITHLIDIELQQEASNERRALLGMMADVRGAYALSLANIRAFLLSGNLEFKADYDKMWAKYLRRYANLKENASLLTVQQHQYFVEMEAAVIKFNPLPSKMFEIRMGDNWNLANAWLGAKAAPAAFAIKQQLDAMIQDQNSMMLSDKKIVQAEIDFLRNLEWTLLVVGVVVSVIVGYIVLKIVSNVTIPIIATIQKLTEGAEAVSSASEQISAVSRTTAEGATEQAASLEQISASLEELTTMNQNNCQNTKAANETGIHTQETVQSGICIMKKMKSSIEDIKNSTDKTAAIIRNIDEISFQTNLLALNAAVEAARAGDAGKGFAVVAEEVRNLAQRSADAAKETSVLIQESLDRSQAGVIVADEVDHLLAGIVKEITSMAHLINEVNTASTEQSVGMSQITTAIGQINIVTQTSAENASQSADASNELTRQAISLNEMLDGLALVVGGR